MNRNDKKKFDFHNILNMSRRNFLWGGSAAAASAALLAAPTVAFGASGKISPHFPDSTGGARIKQLEDREGWLGTSRIVGEIAPKSELDSGFSQAALGAYGEEIRTQFFRFDIKYPLGDAFGMLGLHMAGEDIVDGVPAEEKLPIPDPERMSKHIKELARFLRADECGIGLMPMHSIYTERLGMRPSEDPNVSFEVFPTPTNYNTAQKNVIVVLVDQDLRTTLGSSGYDSISLSQSYLSYSTSGFIACIMAKYIRNLGYSARAHHAWNYQASLPPALISAGLGEHSRASDCVLHPRLGYRHKAAIITTDLPLMHDKPIDFGLQDFCRTCKKCAEHCPAKAISSETEKDVYNGYERWSGDFRKCAEFRAGNREGSSCGRCMKVCPWNNKEDSWFHTLSTAAASRSAAACTLLREMDDIFGYGTEEIQEFKWWLEWPHIL